MILNLFNILLPTFLALIWVDYLRRIDLFRNKSVWLALFVFAISTCTPFLIPFIDEALTYVGVFKRNEYISDMVYYFIGVGMKEEGLKFAPLFLAMIFFKGVFREPLDYVLLACFSALGFSLSENVMYCMEHGVSVLSSRGVLSVPTHMFDATLFVYGFVLNKFNPKPNKYISVFIFMYVAVFSHAFYDYWLDAQLFKGGIVITVFYYFITMSLFATILNNCLNNSAHFNPKKVINSGRLMTWMMTYYFIFYFILSMIVVANYSFIDTMKYIMVTALINLFILIVLIVRLSRFKLISGRWNPIRFEFPFYFYSKEEDDHRKFYNFFHVKIRGDSYNEFYINQFYEEYFSIVPLSSKNTFIEKARIAYIEKKIYLRNDETFYLVKVFPEYKNSEYVYFLMRAKTKGRIFSNNKSPLASIYKIESMEKLDNTKSFAKSFRFLEWVCLKPAL